MSSRPEHHRRERSWERDNRDRGRYSRGGPRNSERRSSRSRSPRRGERRDRHEYKKNRDDEWRGKHKDKEHERDRDRARDRKDDRGIGKRDDDRSRDDRKSPPQKEDEKNSIAETHGDDSRPPRFSMANTSTAASEKLSVEAKPSRARLDLDPDAGEEEGEAMDAVNDDDAAMMALMGLNGFGTTKGKQVEGNQEGSVQLKKQRTWRQYMNRRGGFNRPLDKIK